MLGSAEHRSSNLTLCKPHLVNGVSREQCSKFRRRIFGAGVFQQNQPKADALGGGPNGLQSIVAFGYQGWDRQLETKVSASSKLFMWAQNFTWSDGICLCAEGTELDLHNSYDFQGFSYDIEGRTVSLHWRRGLSEWVGIQLPARICVEIHEVHYFRFEPRDPKYPFTEDDCLASFGYDSDEDWADGQFWTDGSADPNWRWSFAFQSGAEIIVGGERAVVDLQPNGASQ